MGEDEAHFKTLFGDLSPLTFERQWAAAATILPLAADRGMAVMMDAATRRRMEEFTDTSEASSFRARAQDRGLDGRARSGYC